MTVRHTVFALSFWVLNACSETTLPTHCLILYPALSLKHPFSPSVCPLLSTSLKICCLLFDLLSLFSESWSKPSPKYLPSKLSQPPSSVLEWEVVYGMEYILSPGVSTKQNKRKLAGSGGGSFSKIWFITQICFPEPCEQQK